MPRFIRETRRITRRIVRRTVIIVGAAIYVDELDDSNHTTRYVANDNQNGTVSYTDADGNLMTINK